MAILPEGEELRKAVKWISEERVSHPKKNIAKLIEEACFKYDLSPKDGEFLFRCLTQKESSEIP